MGLIGSLFGGIASGIASGITAKKQREQQQKQFEQGLAFQREENQIARDWNEKMADKANQWARENVADERAYNNPSAVMDRLKKAGLNPDLMYSNGAGSLVDANVANSYVADSVQPSDVLGASMQVQPTAGLAANIGIQMSKTLAEIDNLKADTAKTKGELDTISLDNVRKAATNGSMIELANMQVTIAKQAMQLTDEQITNMVQQTNNLKTANDQMNQQIVESAARAKNLDASTLRARIEAGLALPRFKNECRSLAQEIKRSNAAINLSDKQAQCLVIKTLAEKLNLDADTMYKKIGASKLDVDRANAVLQGDVIKVTGRQLELNYKSDQSYKDWERACDMATKVFNSAGNVLNALIPF